MRPVRFAPVDFDPKMVDLVAATAGDLGHSVKRMPSGAYTAPKEIAAGAKVLLQVMLSTATR